MTKQLKTAATVAMLATMSMASLPANALSLEDMVRFYLGVPSNNNSAFAPNQALIHSNFNTRASQLEAQITADLNAGRISLADATTLRNELSRIRSAYTNFMADGGFSHPEVNIIVGDFRNLTNRLQHLASIGGGGSAVIGSDVNARQAELTARLNTAVRLGQLSPQEAQSLRFSLNWTARLERDMRADGGLSVSEHNMLLAALNRIDQRMDQWIQIADNTTSDVEHRVAQLENRVRQALNQGRINRNQFNNLMASVRWIRNFVDDMERSGRGVTANEERLAINAIARVDARMDNYIANRFNNRFF
jgi:flagellar biosynthesis component FlhA